MSLQSSSPDEYADRRARLAEVIAWRRVLEEREALEGNFRLFVDRAWPQIDPTPFQPCWAIDALCEHLQAVTDGKIRRLLVNFPPRCAKTNIASILWHGWTWARGPTSPLSGPQVRFLAGSYSLGLSLTIANKVRRLLRSPWYQHRWGGRFSLAEDQNTKTQFDLVIDGVAAGGRVTTSVGSTVLGIGGDIICFPEWQAVHTERGFVPIGRLVRERERVRVWSYDSQTGNLALKPIKGWFSNPGSPIVRVNLSDGSTFDCTPDHKVWTERGWVAAARLNARDLLPYPSLPDIRDGGFIDTKAPRQAPVALRGAQNFAHRLFRELCFLVAGAARPIVWLAQAIGNLGPRFAAADLFNSSGADSVTRRKGRGALSAQGNFCGSLSGKLGTGPAFMDGEGTVVFGVGDVVGTGTVFEIAKAWAAGVAVLMAHLLSRRARSNKSAHDELVHKNVVRSAVPHQADTRVPLVQRCPEYSGSGDPLSWFATNKSVWADGIVGEPRYRSPVSVRFIGHVGETFCLEVADYNTFLVGGGDIIVSNCVDDPHNTDPKEIEGSADREAALDWWREISTTRLNDPANNAIVVIMQRLHEEDVSGFILGGDTADDWTHLMIPMEYEPDRRCTTSIGWTDPRTKPGELMWPERFSASVIAQMKVGLGSYMASGRLQQSPAPTGGGIIKRHWWQLYDREEAIRQGVPVGSDLTAPLAYPSFSYIVASLDTAYTEDQENDPSALTVWGVWQDRYEVNRVMLITAWADWLELNPLVDKVAQTCRKYRVDRILVESKAAGMPVAQELRRLHQNVGHGLALNHKTKEKGEFGVQIVDPGRQDKVARGYAITPVFEAGLVYAPDKDWAEKVIDECAKAPKGAHDDLFDTTTQAIRHLRVARIIELPGEVQLAQEQLGQHRSVEKPLYAV